MKKRNQKLLGIEIGGTKLQVAVGAVEGGIEQQWRYTINAAAGASGIRAQLEERIAAIGAETIAAVGVGFGGPVDWKTGVIQTSHQVAGWNKFNLKEWLEGLTQAPAAIDNDANVAALAEALQGSGRNYDPVFYITIGSGIGGGVVKDGAIYHGAIPGEVEIGHLRLSKHGTTVESECSGWAVNKKVRQYIQSHPQSLLAQLSHGHSAPEALLLQPALEKRDAAAGELLTGIADDLAFALSHVVHLFHPQVVVLGGGLSLIGEPLRQRVAERLPYYVMQAFLPAPAVQLALLGEGVVPAGALALAKQAFYSTQGKISV